MNQVTNITAAQMKQAMDEKAVGMLLDVRTPQEFARGKITGSINVPVDEVIAKAETLIPDKQTSVYIYCLSGSRSIAAAAALEKLGYSKLFNLTNGLLEWRVAGLAVE